MMGFAQGIDICYGSTKNDRNVVFFQDGTYRDYRIGGIIEEIARDEVVSMLTDGVKEIVDLITIDTETDPIEKCHSQICESFEKLSAPTAGAICQSSFYEAFLHESIQPKKGTNSKNGVFAKECFDYYLDQFSTFAGFVEAIALRNSGCCDEDVHEIVELFERWAEGYGEDFPGYKDVFQKDDVVTIGAHRVMDWLPLLLLEYSRIKKHGKGIKFCENCGRIFVPQNRSDTIYCDNPSPQNPKRSCREIGAQMRRKKKRNIDDIEREHHNKICKLHNMVRRAKNRGDRTDLIAYYREKIDAEMLKYEGMKARNSK